MKGESMTDERTTDEFRHRWVGENPVAIPSLAAGTEPPTRHPGELGAQELNWARELIGGLTYREGSNIWISDYASGRLVISCTMSTVDVDHYYDHAEIRCSRAVDTYRLCAETSKGWFQASLMREVWMMLRDLEDHERMEWLRVGGQTVYDPHPGGRLNSTSVPDLEHPRLEKLGKPDPKREPVGMGFTVARDDVWDKWLREHPVSAPDPVPAPDPILEKLKALQNSLQGHALYTPPAPTDHSRDRIEAEWAAGKEARREQEMVFPELPPGEVPWYRAPGDVHPYLNPLPLPEPIPWPIPWGRAGQGFTMDMSPENMAALLGPDWPPT